MVLVASCTAFDPIVIIDPNDAKVSGTGYEQATPLPKAVNYGEEVMKAYRQRISDQMLLENSAAGSLIAIAASAFGLGATGGGRDWITGLGAAGAAVFVGSRYYASKLQQHVYAAGAAAISCSITAMAPRRAAYAHLNELKQLVEGAPNTAEGSMREDLDQLQILVDKWGSNAQFRTSDDFIYAQAALATGKAAEARGREAIAALEDAGGELMGAIARIEVEVDREIIDARPDLSSVLASLSGAIPTAVTQITPKPPSPALSKGTGKAALPDTTEQKKLEDLPKQVERKARRINLIADKVGEQPPAEALAKCKVDVQKEGLTFKLDQQGEILVDASKADRAVTISATGGTPPYVARWSGLTPSEKIDLKTEDRFQGIFTVKVSKGAPADKYVVLVTDGSKGRGTVTLNVVSGTGGTTAARPPASPAKDAAVEQLQNDLINAGIKTATVGGADQPLKADGIWGDVTKEAIKRFLTEKAHYTGQVPADKDALIRLARENGL